MDGYDELLASFSQVYFILFIAIGFPSNRLRFNLHFKGNTVFFAYYITTRNGWLQIETISNFERSSGGKRQKNHFANFSTPNFHPWLDSPI